MDKLITITLNAFQETLRRRIFYIVFLLALLILIVISSQMFFLRMARQAGESQMIAAMGTQIVQMIVGVWQAAVFFLALFLGATGLASEISARTLVHILSRPVERWIYLLARWLGILIFLWAFLSIGVIFALAVSLWLHVGLLPTFWLGMAEIYIEAAFYSGVALGLSVAMPPVPAGILAFLLPVLPAICSDAIHDPRWLHQIPALIGYYLGPARMPVNLIEESFAKVRLHADYLLYLRVLIENCLYAVVVFVLATRVLRRREIRVR